MQISYLDKPSETLDGPSLERMQLGRLRETVDRTLRTEFYKKKLEKAGIFSGRDIKSLLDVRRLPFTTKNDLRDAYPRKHLAVPMDRVVRIHMSSGTTGIPDGHLPHAGRHRRLDAPRGKVGGGNGLRQGRYFPEHDDLRPVYRRSRAPLRRREGPALP